METGLEILLYTFSNFSFLPCYESVCWLLRTYASKNEGIDVVHYRYCAQKSSCSYSLRYQVCEEREKKKERTNDMLLRIEYRNNKFVLSIMSRTISSSTSRSVSILSALHLTTYILHSVISLTTRINHSTLNLIRFL